MKNTNDTDDILPDVNGAEDTNVACQVRRKIEEYLERRRNKDELGNIDDDLEMA